MRENKIKGWMSVPELEFLYETAKGMDTIVELGSYLGRSTVALAQGCEGNVWAVDHWDWKDGLGLVMDGTEYQQFLNNTKDFNNIYQLRMTTLEAVKEIDKADMVFIDADHRYKSVSDDIYAWKPKAKKIICGHDYDLSSVRQAVDELLNVDGVVGSIWYKWL